MGNVFAAVEVFNFGVMSHHATNGDGLLMVNHVLYARRMISKATEHLLFTPCVSPFDGASTWQKRTNFCEALKFRFEMEQDDEHIPRIQMPTIQIHPSSIYTAVN